MPHAKPITIRGYKYHRVHKNVIENMVANMLGEDIVKPSNSLFACPVI